MQQREPSWSQWSTVIILACLTGGIAFVALAVQRPGNAHMEPASPVMAAQQVPPAAADAATNQEQPLRTNERIAVPTTSPQKPPLVFEDCITQLCAMSLRIAELAQDDEIEAARSLDGQTRDLINAVLQQFADAGERSLAMLIQMAGGPEVAVRPALENTRLGVLQMLLESELSRRHELAMHVKDPSKVDALVQALLDAMPIASLTTQMGDRCLNRAPYLRIVHEPSVLQLLQLVNESQFPRSVATNMLMTLWDNVKANGERTSAELTQLAMLGLDGADPSQILTACRQLLLDGKYRTVVLTWLREREDPELAGELAQLAARELPVRDALDILRELAPLLPHTRGAYTGLGIRAPEALADAYREHLAANNQPNIRLELIMGVGMLPDPAGLKVAELALANDPSPAVRIQAMYVFTVHATPQATEQAINQLLDDPAIAEDPHHLGAVVQALLNLEQGDPNVVARLGARLQSMGLADYSRVSLNEILARTLPGGGEPEPKRGG